MNRKPVVNEKASDLARIDRMKDGDIDYSDIPRLDIWQYFWDGVVSESRRKEKGTPCEEYRARRLKSQRPGVAR